MTGLLHPSINIEDRRTIVRLASFLVGLDEDEGTTHETPRDAALFVEHAHTLRDTLVRVYGTPNTQEG